MIASLTGLVREKLQELVIVEVGGVGYGVFVTAEDFGSLAPEATVRLYIHEHIRDNAHDLYGFTGQDTKELFEQLLEVNGVGPRMALNILSIGSAPEVREAIASGDTKSIQAANGVGRRVAERVVVDLKDKVGLTSADLSSTLMRSERMLIKDEAVEALVALGYEPRDAASALASVPKALSTEERVKQALREAGR